MRKRIACFISAVVFLCATLMGRIGYIVFGGEYTVSQGYNSYSLTACEIPTTLYYSDMGKINNNKTVYLAVIRPNEKCIGELYSLFDYQKRNEIIEKLKKGYPIIEKLDTDDTPPSLKYIKIIKATEEKSTDMQIINKESSGLLYYVKNKNGKIKVNFSVDARGRLLDGDEGTVIYDDESGKVIADMSGDNLQETILKGGRGGKGNMNYATSTMQAPQYAQPGQDAQELWVRLELKVIADVGLVGFPNVGKSTFLSRVTNARPKIANYHFTTLNPNLGVVDLDGGKGFVIADIPGLIEGASEGVGLGHQFLRHIERTKVIIHIVDAASTEGRDPIADIKAINKELENYNPKLLERPQVIAANKIDVIYDDGSDPVQAIRDAFEPEGIKVYPISAVTGQGVKELLYAVRTLLDNFKDEPVLFEKEFDYDELMDNPNESFEVSINEDGVYVVNGPKIDKMLGYTNLESEKGFDFFQKFMKRSGVLDELEKLGIEEGDTVIVGDYLEFDYYKA